MGISIAADVSGPYPRPLGIELVCDGDHGLFGQPSRMFHGISYPAAHSLAMRLGWLERNGDDGRSFLCPECSGKKPEKCETFP